MRGSNYVLAILGASIFGFMLFFKDEITETVEVNLPGNWERFDSLFKKYGSAYGVPWTWLKAVCLNESNLGAAKSVARGLASPSDIEGSKSSDGLSWGIMQVTLRTARELDPAATQEKLNNPEYSIKLSAQYFKKLSSLFSKIDLRYTEWVIKSYNQGPGNTKKEIAGTSSGFAQEYWNRFQRNLTRVEESQ